MIYISFGEHAGHVTLVAKVLRSQHVYQATWTRVSNSVRTKSGTEYSERLFKHGLLKIIYFQGPTEATLKP